MKVTKAIQLLTALEYDLDHRVQQDEADALKLSIEALEKHRDRDYRGFSAFIDKLPGED